MSLTTLVDLRSSYRNMVKRQGPSAGSEPDDKIKASIMVGKNSRVSGSTFFSWMSKVHQTMTAVFLILNSDFSCIFKGVGRKSCAYSEVNIRVYSTLEILGVH